jgi:hypothetical protein
MVLYESDKPLIWLFALFLSKILRGASFKITNHPQSVNHVTY